MLGFCDGSNCKDLIDLERIVSYMQSSSPLYWHMSRLLLVHSLYDEYISYTFSESLNE